ncbi:PLD nuclease N-terminal domain-containing protein [Lacticaseibacillus absianus]|uniref:PLD nuclease N-terminal domain-containing protein n=1 Tax=Lacticaseibacillus absianus TaxID=2729623 RepID=UPI0015CAC7A6|nr:PLD nuclease N-terminal domain-containing protein [Lacticaseibacillus absianus]
MVQTYLPLLLPIIGIELILTVTAVVSILRHTHYAHGNRTLWLIVAIVIQPFGALAYFLFGREAD